MAIPLPSFSLVFSTSLPRHMTRFRTLAEASECTSVFNLMVTFYQFSFALTHLYCLPRVLYKILQASDHQPHLSFALEAHYGAMAEYIG